MIASLGLALVAGLLSILSPCVLPLLPILIGAALSEHRLGPAALAVGLALSFTTIGVFVATLGFAIGLDADAFRIVAALGLAALGVVLLIPQLQDRVAVAAGPIGQWTERRFGGFSTTGVPGQFSLGLLLGAVWSPCVGPTLGAASVMAARGENLGEVALTMLSFGIGAGLPLIGLGFLSREQVMRWRARLSAAGKAGKMALGGLLVATGLAVVLGVDRWVEATLVGAAPDWLIGLTTRF